MSKPQKGTMNESLVPYNPGERPPWKETFQAYFRLSAMAFRADRVAFVLMAITILIEPLIYALIIYSTARIVDSLTQGIVAETWFWIASMTGAWVIRNIANAVFYNRLDRLRQIVTVELESRYLAHLTKLPYKILEDPKFIALASIVSEKRGQVGVVFDSSLEFLSICATLTGLATVVFYIPWPVAVVTLAAMILRFVTNNKQAMLQWTILNMQSREGRRAIYYRRVIEQPAELEKAKGIGLTSRFLSHWNKIARMLLEKRLQERMRNSIWGFISFQFDNLGLGIGMVLIAKGIMDGTVPMSSFVVFLSNFQRLTPQMRELFQTSARFMADAPVVPLVFRTLDLPVEPDRGKTLPETTLIVRFDDVHFRYPGAQQEVLRGVTFEFREGDHLALVGLNGAGKTTLLKLLMGVYEPTAGSITVNGTRLQDVKPSVLRRVLAIMSQEPPRYSDPVIEQVHYGDYESRVDSERLDGSVQASGLSEIITDLPQGMNTVVGKVFAMPEDQAIELSGGQNQILTIARTLYRNARIYVFDEPTSAVDAEKEESFFSRLPETLRGKAIIFVSHRFSTLRRAKRILVLEDGRLIEDGTHEELIELKGRYAELFTLQAKNYQ